MPVVIPCRLCGDRATVVCAMDRGCVCYPNDREQALCEQHFWKSEPLGSMVVIRDLVAEAEIG